MSRRKRTHTVISAKDLLKLPGQKGDKTAMRAGMTTRTGEMEPGYIAPANETESKLQEMCKEILRTGTISMGDNYFKIGGSSLNAAVLVSRIHKEFNVALRLGDIFKKPQLKQLARTIAEAGRNSYAAITPVDKKDHYPLSSAQMRMYIIQQMDTGSTAYNMPVVEILDAPDTEKLQNSFKKLVQRHESLRTTFEIVNGTPVQRVHEDVPFVLETVETGKGDIREIAANFVKPFELDKAPLLRAGIIKTGEKQVTLMVDIHHLITDGTSNEIILKELTALYHQQEMPPRAIQYKDYAVLQSSGAWKQAKAKQEEYWLQQFQKEMPPLQLPLDYPRPPVQSYEGDKVGFTVTPEETRALRNLAGAAGATTYMVLLALFNIMLSKISRQQDIYVGTPVEGRGHYDLYKIVGLFVNTLVLRNYPHRQKTFQTFLGEIKNNTLKALENQDYPFEELVEKIVKQRDNSRNPIFDIMFVYQNQMETEETVETVKTIENEETEKTENGPETQLYLHPVAKFDMTLTCFDEAQQLAFTIEYGTTLFKRSTMERYARYFKELVTSVIKNSKNKLGELEIIPEKEKRDLLTGFNSGTANPATAAYPEEKTLREIFENQAHKTPAKIALSALPGTDETHREEGEKKEELTYRELNEEANRMAWELKKRGVYTEEIVGIIAGPSTAMMVGILAILKAGAAYLPIDPQLPTARTAFMLADSAVRNILAPETLRENIVGDKYNVIDLEPAKYTHNPANNIEEKGNSKHPAYVIYTSGTTGKPKGVLIKHHNVVQLFFNEGFQFDFDDTDVWTLFHTFNFDFSVWEMYGA
ncbi:MAG: AMP-binding protein, partial [bacterium]|nr:AMP-binding protein [bacterium]